MGSEGESLPPGREEPGPRPEVDLRLRGVPDGWQGAAVQAWGDEGQSSGGRGVSPVGSQSRGEDVSL